MALLARVAARGVRPCVRWPERWPSPTTISYTYDPAGRRIEKQYDGLTQMKYLYDGDHIIAEYSGNGGLLHKYIYGPGVDQPICMIDVTESNAAYYYHFDGLGSVIALTDSSGSVANLYEYSVYGEVSASDPNHPNRFLFTGREFDKDTGLYYYRARYYNPYIGRFLQTDPAGYGAGMNLYRYCANNSINMVDPTGMLLVPTGRIIVTVGHLTPADLPYGDTIGMLISVGGILNTLSKLEATTVTGAVFGKLSSIDSCMTYKVMWHTYIEVWDYNDTNRNGEIDPDDLRTDYTWADLFGKPFWLEIHGALADSDKTAGAVWVCDEPTGGYESYAVAYRAAETVYKALQGGGEVKDLDRYRDPTQTADVLNTSQGLDLSTLIADAGQTLDQSFSDPTKRAEVLPVVKPNS